MIDEQTTSIFETFRPDFLKWRYGDAFRNSLNLPEANWPIREIVIGAEHSPWLTVSRGGALVINTVSWAMLGSMDHMFVDILVKYLASTFPDAPLFIEMAGIDLFLKGADDIEVVKSVHRVISLFHYFLSEQGKSLASRDRFADMDWHQEPFLFVRPGNVELRALRTLYDPTADLDMIVDEVTKAQQDEAAMYAPSTSSDVDVDDKVYTIRQLITNAGMCGTGEELRYSLLDWSKQYMAGLQRGQELAINWHYTIHSHAARIIAAHGRAKPWSTVRFGPFQRFYDNLAGRRILFVTPYADAITRIHRAGKYRDLWSNHRVPAYEMEAIQAPITTFPNTESSWSKVFSTVAAEASARIVEKDFDLVLASCGCYGIPLLNYLNAKFNVSAIYNGNIMNMFFGVLQNAFKSHMAQAKIENWINPYESGLELPRNYGRIDDGRYLADARQ